MYGDFLPFWKLNSSVCSYKKSQQDTLFLKCILIKKLYMFQTDLLSIICLKHVEFFIKINLRNSASRWLLLKEYITMHGILNVKFCLSYQCLWDWCRGTHIAIVCSLAGMCCCFWKCLLIWAVLSFDFFATP